MIASALAAFLVGFFCLIGLAAWCLGIIALGSSWGLRKQNDNDSSALMIAAIVLLMIGTMALLGGWALAKDAGI